MSVKKCVKCGITSIEDGSIRFHCFPKGKKTIRARAWATFCWPEQDWSTEESLTTNSAIKSTDLLCSRHFLDSCYLDTAKKFLSPYSVPGTREYVNKLMAHLRSCEQKSQVKPPRKIRFRGKPTCQNSHSSSHRVLHKFPNPICERERFNQWVTSIGGDISGLKAEYIFKHRSVCHDHFEQKYFCSGSRVSCVAIPTLNLPGPLLGFSTHNDHPYSKETSNATKEFKRVETATNAQKAEEEPSIDLPPTPLKCGPQINIPLDLPLFDPAKFSCSNIYDDADEFSDDHFDSSSPIPEENHANSKPESPNVATAEEKKAGPIFSWERDIDLVPTEDKEVVVGPTIASNVELTHTPIDITMYSDDEPRADPMESVKHAEYTCNVCHKEILGFRYTCVQCPDWDLCGACEGSAAHATHYVLRVPGPRPYNEIQAVLSAVRQQLLSENLFLQDDTLTGIKVEPKDESDSENVQPAPASPDPLEEWISIPEEDLSDEANSTGSLPRRKRRNSSGNENESLIPIRRPELPRKYLGCRPHLERASQPTNQITRARGVPNVLQANRELRPHLASTEKLLRRIRGVPLEGENRPKSEKCSQTEGWPIKKSVAIPPYIRHTVHKSRHKTDISASNPSTQDHHRQTHAPIKTKEPNIQTDSPNVLQSKIQTGLYHDLTETHPTAYQLTDPAVLDGKTHSNRLPNKFSRVGRPRRISTLNKVLERDMKGKVNRQTVLLKIPSGTNALDLSKALQCQASVQIERLKKVTLKTFNKKMGND